MSIAQPTNTTHPAMAGPARQRTFDLVPETLVPQNPPKKAMTLKKAKKAAAAATKGPKLSRAERVRIEKEELDRQRKERDRQRASEKGRLAREKKAAKLEEEKNQRRKMGIPEPSKFVRASQPTISGFVTSGNKRRRTDVEDSHTYFHEPIVEEEISDCQDPQTQESPPQQHEMAGLLFESNELDVEAKQATIPHRQSSQAILSSTPRLPEQLATRQEKIDIVATKVGGTSPAETLTKDDSWAGSEDAIKHGDEFGNDVSDEFGDEFDDDDAELVVAMVQVVEREAARRGRSATSSVQSSHSKIIVQDPVMHKGILGSYDSISSKTTGNSVRKSMLPPSLPSEKIAEPTGSFHMEKSIPKAVPDLGFTNSVALFTEGALYAEPESMSVNLPAHHPTNGTRPPLGGRSINMPPPSFPSKRTSDPPTALVTPQEFYPTASQERRELQEEENSENPASQDHQKQILVSSLEEKGQISENEATGLVTGQIDIEIPDDFWTSASQDLRELQDDNVIDEASSLVQKHPAEVSGQKPVTSIEDDRFGKSRDSLPWLPPPIGRVRDLKPKISKPKTRFFKEKEEDLDNHGAIAALSKEKQQ